MIKSSSLRLRNPLSPTDFVHRGLYYIHFQIKLRNIGFERKKMRNQGRQCRKESERIKRRGGPRETKGKSERDTQRTHWSQLILDTFNMLRWLHTRPRQVVVFSSETYCAACNPACLLNTLVQKVRADATVQPPADGPGLLISIEMQLQVPVEFLAPLNYKAEMEIKQNSCNGGQVGRLQLWTQGEARDQKGAA